MELQSSAAPDRFGHVILPIRLSCDCCLVLVFCVFSPPLAQAPPLGVKR